MISNPQIQNRGKIFNYALDLLTPPQRNSGGATFHGEVSAGSYRVRLWAYPQYFDDKNNISTPYLDPKKTILLPETPRFKLGFAAVPQLVSQGGPVKGAFMVGDYINERNTAHIYDIKSAGVAIPVTVDQIYTFKSVA